MAFEVPVGAGVLCTNPVLSLLQTSNSLAHPETEPYLLQNNTGCSCLRGELDESLKACPVCVHSSIQERWCWCMQGQY